VYQNSFCGSSSVLGPLGKPTAIPQTDLLAAFGSHFLAERGMGE